MEGHGSHHSLTDVDGSDRTVQGMPPFRRSSETARLLDRGNTSRSSGRFRSGGERMVLESAIGKKNRVSNKRVKFSVLGKQPTLGKVIPFPNDGFKLE